MLVINTVTLRICQPQWQISHDDVVELEVLIVTVQMLLYWCAGNGTYIVIGIDHIYTRMDADAGIFKPGAGTSVILMMNESTMANSR